MKRMLGALCALLLVCASQTAQAERLDRPGHFETDDGKLGFVLDLSGEMARQRFDSSPEILLLRPIAAARGDTIYQRSDGKVVLRRTPFGALTLYTSSQETGLPVVRVGDADPLVQTNRTVQEVVGLAALLQQHLQKDYRLSIRAELPQLDSLKQPAEIDTIGDAIENARIAFERLLSLPNGPPDVDRAIDRVRIEIAGDTSVTLANETLSIDVVPALRLHGRPSSYDIDDAVYAALKKRSQGQAGTPQGSANRPDQHSLDFRW